MPSKSRTRNGSPADKSLRVLIVQDGLTTTDSLTRLLAGSAIAISEVESVQSCNAALKILDANHFDLVLFGPDFAEPQYHKTLAIINRKHPTIPTVVLTGDYDRLLATLNENFAAKKQARTIAQNQENREMLFDAAGEGVLPADARKIYEVLDRKQKNLEAIFDAAPVAMLMLDENLTVKRVNDAVRKMLHRQDTQILSKKLGAAIGCVDNAGGNGNCRNCRACSECALHDVVQTTLKSNEPVHGVEIQPTLQVDGGQIRPWLRLSAEPTLIDTRKYLVLALDDITDRKKAELALKNTMQAKSQFLATVAHEMRTPLASLKNAVTVILEGAAGRVTNEQKNFLDIAKRNVNRLTRLINDVLDFEKLDAGKADFDMRMNDITEVVKDVHRTMAHAALAEGIDLTMELDENLPKARFDHHKMIQVLSNLVSNAVKFTPKHGKVCVEVSCDDEELIIRVKDNGVGIPNEDIPKIFERFYTVPQLHKQVQGTGLGLAIVRKIVNMHNGTIDVESQINNGATFTVVLPLPGPCNEAESTQNNVRESGGC